MNSASVQAVTDFDVSRALLGPVPGQRPFAVQHTEPLADALRRGEVTPTTSLQVMEGDGRALAFVTQQLMYHVVAQTEDQLATFCGLCNGGVVFSPQLDGRTLHFAQGGMYNAMVIIRDQETGTYWDHVAGRALHGPLAGAQLTRLSDLRHMPAVNTLAAYPDAQIALSTLSQPEQAHAAMYDSMRVAANPAVPEAIINTLREDDSRLPRMSLGLGVWTAAQARYYPMLTLNATNNVLVDKFAGRNLMVYVEPTLGVPVALFTEATSAEWFGTALRLSTGERILDGVISGGRAAQPTQMRPPQLFQRWYGFSTAFQNTEIYKSSVA